MNLKVKRIHIQYRRYLSDIVKIEAEVPGLDKITTFEVQVDEGKGLQYLQENFSKGELGSYDIVIQPFVSEREDRENREKKEATIHEKERRDIINNKILEESIHEQDNGV